MSKLITVEEQKISLEDPILLGKIVTAVMGTKCTHEKIAMDKTVDSFIFTYVYLGLAFIFPFRRRMSNL
jgi:hypothetical protein